MASPDTDVNNAPNYITQYVTPPNQNSVAELLFDGSWCGHGEKLYRVYDIIENGNSDFQIQLPDTETEESFPIAVRLTSARSQKQILVYDTRKHPASWYAFGSNAKKKSKFLDTYYCNKCNEINFRISIGFEVPEDSSSVDDTSWFVMATECAHCGDRRIAFDDETA